MTESSTRHDIRFGTDGIRGRAGQWPLTPEGARAVGTAVALWSRGPVVVGWDTRESSPELARAVLEGVAQGGVLALEAGVLPTPALSCALAELGATAAVMVTASHNPWQDNGLKVLGSGGKKVFDPTAIEALVGATGPGGGSMERVDDASRAWREAMPHVDLSGRRVMFDAANGADAELGPRVLTDLGAEVVRRACSPNGRNINDGVGALHPPTDLQGADLAICVDGDGDRLAIVDRRLGLLDGDDLLYVLASGSDEPVVGTIMTNGGLEQALGSGRLVRAPVGDRFVAEAMSSRGVRLGGEPSGHLLFVGGLPTSCGLYTALQVLQTIALRGWPEPARFERLPQVTVNVRATAVPDPLPAVDEARASGHRVVVRKSGTEALVRVMVEGPDAAKWAPRIATAITA